MKTLLFSLFSLCVLNAAEPVKPAAEPAKPAAAAQPGRRLEAPGIRADFLIRPDRKATVTIIDAAGKPVLLGEHTVILKVDGKDVALEPEPNSFITKEPLTAKELTPIIIQIRASAAGKPANFRLTLDTSLCGGCKRPEYGCTCDH